MHLDVTQISGARTRKKIDLTIVLDGFLVLQRSVVERSSFDPGDDVLK